jgi:asparagine synthase (glutamine-hydrolysing)
MCGFLAVVGASIPMTEVEQVLCHRGPDDAGHWAKATHSGVVSMVSTRLSIRDLSALGHMPMSNTDGSVVLSYNGEIYNHVALRRHLIAAGFVPQSDSDTELVLKAYELYGPQCVEHLDGMFAFALWDDRRGQLFLARDHFGIKPLYYVQRGGTFACGSEVKALLRVPGVEARVNEAALGSYLTFLWVPDPATMFDGILKLEAGHSAIYKDGKLSITKYWDLQFPEAGTEFTRSEDDLVAEFRHRFSSSVRNQMVSDVPVGAFLSAGLDSSSIVAEMAKASSDSVQTFTIAFEGNASRSTLTLDDTAVAARTANKLGCTHHEILVKPDVVDLLPKLIWHLDEPIADPAAITAYLVNREAKPHATVLMSGVGGDELLAGYRKHVALAWSGTYQKLPSALRSGLILPAIERLPAFHGSRLADPVRLAKKMVRSSSLGPDESFLMNSTYFDRQGINRLVGRSHREAVALIDPWERHRRHFAAAGDADHLNRMLYVDTKAFMTSLNLTYNDKMSMAASTEVRVPFLDRELVEFVATHVPPAMKLKGKWKSTTKYLLRKAMEGSVPDEVLQQPKAGFGAPVGGWIKGDLAPMIGDLLSNARVQDRGWFEPAEVQAILRQHREGRNDLSLQIWALLTFELWHQQFIDR